MSDPKTPETEARQPNPASEVVPLSELLKQQTPVKEIGGRTNGPEPTRYGDWEKNGRCIDF